MHATSPGTLHRPTHNCMQYIFYSWGILTRVIGLFCFILLISTYFTSVHSEHWNCEEILVWELLEISYLCVCVCVYPFIFYRFFRLLGHTTCQYNISIIRYLKEIRWYWKRIDYTANAYRQMTDKLMFKSVISTVRWIRK